MNHPFLSMNSSEINCTVLTRSKSIVAISLTAFVKVNLNNPSAPSAFLMPFWWPFRTLYHVMQEHLLELLIGRAVFLDFSDFLEVLNLKLYIELSMSITDNEFARRPFFWKQFWNFCEAVGMGCNWTLSRKN